MLPGKGRRAQPLWIVELDLQNFLCERKNPVCALQKIIQPVFCEDWTLFPILLLNLQ